MRPGLAGPIRGVSNVSRAGRRRLAQCSPRLKQIISFKFQHISPRLSKERDFNALFSQEKPLEEKVFGQRQWAENCSGFCLGQRQTADFWKNALKKPFLIRFQNGQRQFLLQKLIFLQGMKN